MSVIDLYNIESLESKSVPVGSTFDQVVIYARCGLSSIAHGQRFRIAIKTNGAEYYGAWQNPIVAQYLTFTKTYSTNPNTSLAWTWAQLNALQIGVDLDPNGNSVFPVYGTQVFARVTYTEPPAGGIQQRWIMMGDSHR